MIRISIGLPSLREPIRKYFVSAGLAIPLRLSRSIRKIGSWATASSPFRAPIYDLTKSRTRSISSIAPNCEPIRISSKPICSTRPMRRRASSGGQMKLTDASFASSADSRTLLEVDRAIGEDGVGAAGLAIDLHAVFEIFQAAVAAGRGPALGLLGGIGDPARAAPGADQDRRPALDPARSQACRH